MNSRMNIRKFLCGVLVSSSIFLMVDLVFSGYVPIAQGLALFLLGIITSAGVSYFISLCNRFEY
tara:strand:+ start:3822 stop:4013 length:192 start_codon:yes stop_codon:yes gene_type:complete